MTCAIIDDEPLAAALLESYVQKTPFLEHSGTFANAIDAMAALSKAPVELLFLDIQMPELSGLEFAKLIPPTTRIIFTTAFSQYAIEGYKVNAFDYLLKPISYADFLAAAQRAASSATPTQSTAEPIGTGLTNETSIFVKSDYKLLRIDFNDILYIEGLKDYVKIYLASTPRPILSLTAMKTLEDNLPAERFMRIHRSYIANMTSVTAIERSNILVGDKSLPISDTYKDKVLEYVNKRLLGGR
jgi:DNA-binding LytR/AlgR family response regulator